jgi:hypothetical protein
VAIGLVIAFVGTGEKGFKTLELRLIGPTLIGSGVLCCLLRVFLCVCPTRCLRRKLRTRRKPRNPAELERKNEYYRHLPFNTRTAEDFMLVRQTTKKSKKRVSILPTVASASETREVPKILLPDVKESSPVEGADLIELKKMEPASSFDDIPSLSSEDSFALDQSLALVEGKVPDDKERLARLKSTLTFGDSLDAQDFSRDHVVSRIDEEDSEDFYSNPVAMSSPLLHDSEHDTKELVLSPSNLKND